MSLSTFIILTTLILLSMAWYANMGKRNKILCRYRRVNKTLMAKFIKMQSRYVVFDGKRHDIVPSCIVFQWYTSGFIHMIFPQWVATLDFTYDSRWPLDPNTLKPAIITPEVRNVINKSEWAESYAKKFQPPTNKKTAGVFQNYLPWLTIGAVVLLGFWMYQNMSVLAHDLATLQNAIRAIPK